MSAPTLSEIFQIGIDVLKTTVDNTTKKILAQIGNVNGAGLNQGDNVEWYQHVGFASRPPKAVPGEEACKAVSIRQGGTDAVIASHDARGLELYGNLADGETCIYAAGEDGEAQARILLKKDGSINLYTRKGNTSGGTGMMISLDAANGAIRLVNDQGYGLIIDADGVKLTAGGAGLVLESGGNVKLIGTGQTQVDGGGICIGSLAVPGVNSALTGVTGLVGKASLKVLIE